MSTSWTKRAFAVVATMAALLLQCGCADFDTEMDTEAVSQYQYGNADTWPSMPRTSLSNTQPTIYGTETELADDGNTLALTVYGGQERYSWGVTDISLGSIVDSGGDSAVYQRNAAGDNVVWVQDGSGRVAYYDIAQP